MTTHDYELGYKQKLAKSKEKNVEGNYYSTYDFVNQTKLSRVATKVLGKGWEAEDDVNQIQEIVNSLGNGKYSVVCSYPTAFKEDIIVTKISDKTNKDIDKAFTQLISLYDICDELDVYGDYKASKMMRDKLNKIGKFIQSLKN
tara:strand:+ start:673 stop:1104 length:432 start_codon:yes stop_codon:yes gene_type:complete